MKKKIINLAKNFIHNLNVKEFEKKGAVDLLFEESRNDSAEYFKKYISDIMLFSERNNEFWDYNLSKVNTNGVVMEFGVFEGKSINYFSNKLKTQKFFGFDSFEGLPNDWMGHSMPDSTFDLGGTLPKVNDNVVLIKGLFKYSLPDFLKNFNESVSLIHIDCDIYESTLEVFNLLGSRIDKGTIVIFDEYHSYPGWRYGEHRALQEACEKFKLNYKYLSINNSHKASIVFV